MNSGAELLQELGTNLKKRIKTHGKRYKAQEKGAKPKKKGTKLKIKEQTQEKRHKTHIAP